MTTDNNKKWRNRKERKELARRLRSENLILETFFHLEEMLIALDCARATNLPIVATISFRPRLTESTDGHSPAECARRMAGEGAALLGANCEQEPARMLSILREMRGAVDIPLAAQPAAFHTTDTTPCFTRLPQFPDDLETIQVARSEFSNFAAQAKAEGLGFLGGCCGCNAAYIRAMASGLKGGSRLEATSGAERSSA